jgi:hypothetical protein
VEGDALGVDASSSGRITISALHVPTVEASVSSSAVVEANGDCGTFSARASSSGRIRAGGLRCGRLTAQASSSGQVQAFANQGATANASSSGRITIAGNPVRVEQHASSGGSVTVTD